MLTLKLKQLITKYDYLNKGTYVITQNKELFNGLDIKFKSETDDFDGSQIIISDHTNFDFINEYINKKKTIILIVPLKYNFNALIKNVKSNSIDAINWKNQDGTKYKDYIIVINKY